MGHVATVGTTLTTALPQEVVLAKVKFSELKGLFRGQHRLPPTILSVREQIALNVMIA